MQNALLIPRLQVVDEKEAVGFPRRLFIQLVELLLRQQGALLHHGVQLVLVAQPPAAEELLVDPHGCADEPQLLRAHPGGIPRTASALPQRQRTRTCGWRGGTKGTAEPALLRTTWQKTPRPATGRGRPPSRRRSEVDVVAALAVGEDLDALDKAGGVGRGWGQRAGAVRVPDAEGDLDGLGVDEGRAAGQRDAADPRGCGGEGAQRAGEVLHVMPRRHVAGVACFQLVVQALHQLILGSGGDYLHACLYTRILTRTAKETILLGRT